MGYTLTLLTFGFVVIGARVIMALIVVWLLVDDERSCVRCDGDTVTVQPPRGTAAAVAALKLERRWCTRCGRSALARRTAPPVEPAAVMARRHAPHADG